MELKRKQFQGVLNILSFNRHFYIYGIIALVLIFVIWHITQWPNYILWVIFSAFLYGLIMPLIVSAYVYDFSGYYEFKWLNKLVKIDSKHTKLVNINAGFDETSYIIKKHFPLSNLKVFDFYSPIHHTEPAIVRARKVSQIYPNTEQITTNHIPLKDNSVDVIFLLSAIHEIRSHKEKVQFLKECHRVCKDNGKIIIVEHLRDLPNFLAFTLGVTHFFSKKTWLNALNNAGFSTVSETKFTPYMSIFNCQINS